MTDLESVPEAGVPSGDLLVRLADAATPVFGLDQATRAANVAALRELGQAMVETLGREALLEAAATIAAFNGLVRIADGTGIQLDPVMERISRDFRSDLGLDDFAGAANTERLDQRSGRSADSPASAMDLFR